MWKRDTDHFAQSFFQTLEHFFEGSVVLYDRDNDQLSDRTVLWPIRAESSSLPCPFLLVSWILLPFSFSRFDYYLLSISKLCCSKLDKNCAIFLMTKCGLFDWFFFKIQAVADLLPYRSTVKLATINQNYRTTIIGIFYILWLQFICTMIIWFKSHKYCLVCCQKKILILFENKRKNNLIIFSFCQFFAFFPLFLSYLFLFVYLQPF